VTVAAVSGLDSATTCVDHWLFGVINNSAFEWDDSQTCGLIDAAFDCSSFQLRC